MLRAHTAARGVDKQSRNRIGSTPKQNKSSIGSFSADWKP